MGSYEKIFVIGGDLRLIKAAEQLKKNGFDVFSSSAAKSEIVPELGFKAGLEAADIVLLGLPSSMDNVTASAPMSDKKVFLSDIAKDMKADTLLLGGRIPPAFCRMLDSRSIKYSDYFLREELAILNAVPTAEGAIEIAMSEMPTTVCGSKFLLTGFGRISKCLAKMLDGLGARVCIAARSHSDLAWARAMGYDTIHINTLSRNVSMFDTIVNTVPSIVIGPDVLSAMREDALIIDLASKPGGVDMSAAKALGRKVIWALSLPGKVAPVTAGEIICTAVMNTINEIITSET